jgi:hypothetical protein
MFKSFLIKHQYKILLLISFFLIFGIGCFVGYNFSQFNLTGGAIEIKDFSSINYTENTSIPQVLGTQSSDDCGGQIKGNINSKGEKIYHMPTGAYYKNTSPEACFKTEEEARNSGFRKSGR